MQNTSKSPKVRTGPSDFRLTAEAVVFGVALLMLVSAPFARLGSAALSIVLVHAWLILTLLALAIWIYRTALGRLKRSLSGQLHRRRYITAVLRVVLYMIPIAVIVWGEYYLIRLLMKIR